MRIACVLDSDFEDSEFKKPVDGLKQAGHEVVVVGLEAGPGVEGQGGRGDHGERDVVRRGQPR